MRKLLLDWDGQNGVELTLLGLGAHQADSAVTALATIYAPLGFALTRASNTRLQLVAGNVQATDGAMARLVRQLAASLQAAGYVVCDDIPMAA